MNKKLLLIIIVILGMLFIGCEKNDEENGDTPTDIPADPVNVTPPTPQKNNVQPTATFQAQGERIKVNLQGLLNPTNNNPITLFYNSSNPAQSNVFVQQNGVTKGLLLTKVSTGNVLQADVVFIVDNSGSMSEEADNVANNIASFAQTLSSSGLDVQFACVGYNGWVTGGINFTTAAELGNYLNRPNITGTRRTEGFAGPDATTLESNASGYNGSVWGENGVVASFYADDFYNWRPSAARVIINFTDESTQPASDLSFNTAELCNRLGGVATVHTVYSGPADTTRGLNGNWSQNHERPWKMSECTGGTQKFIAQDASDLVLTDLPVVGALSNSYLVEYMKGSGTVQEWLVRILIYTSTADGETTYRVTY